MSTPISDKAKVLFDQVNTENTKMGDLKKLAKTIKKDHDLALELWSTKAFYPRMLAVLILDKKELTQDVINTLDQDMQQHPTEEKQYLADWFMANQLMKDKKTIALMESWQHSSSPIQRRIFWYYQARLRWTGQVPPPNTNELFNALENELASEIPEVQWAMNFTAAQIGIFDPDYRSKCIALGKKTGLYADEVAPKGCTPNYLPEFIRIEVGKREQK